MAEELEEQNSLLKASENLNGDAKKAIEDNINGLMNELNIKILERSMKKKAMMKRQNILIECS